MDFDQFRLTALYNVFSSPMRIASYILLSNNNQGVTFSDLEKKFKKIFSNEEIDTALMVLEDLSEVSGNYENRRNKGQRVYKLEPIFARSLKKFINFKNI